MKPYKDMAPGLHLIVKTASETVDLHLGPIWYLERLTSSSSPATGSSSAVRGSRSTASRL